MRTGRLTIRKSLESPAEITLACNKDIYSWWFISVKTRPFMLYGEHPKVLRRIIDRQL